MILERAFFGCMILATIFIPLTVRHFAWDDAHSLGYLVRRTARNMKDRGDVSSRVPSEYRLTGFDDEYVAGYLRAILDIATDI
jgi:hypothetical protein